MTILAFPAHAASGRGELTGKLGFAAAVFMLLTYSQGWELPLTGGGDESQDSGLIRTLFLPAYAAGVFVMALAPWNTLVALLRQPFLVALVAIATLSLVWSVAPDQTQRRIFALGFTTLGGVVLAARYSWARLAEALAAAFAILAVISLITGLFIPSIGRMATVFPGAWRGLWLEKNAFGGNMALGASICAAAAMLNPQRRGLWWSAAALSLGLVLMSTSKTSLLSAMLGVGAFALVGAVRRGPASAVAATWAAVLTLVLLGAVATFAADAVFGLLGKDATLTGRTKIWAAVMRQINERPWQGYGYGAIWDNTNRWGPLAWITKEVGFRADHSHNSWLEQWLAMGVPGLAAWIGCFLQTLTANIWALYRSKGAYLALPFFMVYALMTLTESIAVVYNDMRWVIFVALAAKLAMPDEPTAAAPAPGRGSAPLPTPVRPGPPWR